MPVLALALADVVVRDANPAVLGRVGDHQLDQVPVALLDVRAPPDLGLGLSHPHDQGVPHTLQLGGTQHPRAAGGTHRPGDPAAGEGRRPQLAQLTFETCDLAAQLVPEGALILDSDGLKSELVLCE